MMEKMVADLKRLMPFKETTTTGDLVLIVWHEPQGLSYGVVESIERDNTRKDEWWHVGMQILTIPPQKITWTLREAQFTGKEIFTMGGEKRFVQAVDLKVGVPPTPAGETKPSASSSKKPQLRVIK